MWIKKTGIFIAIIIVLIVVYDFVAIYNGGKEASISQFLIDWGYKYPVSSFLMGFVMGHLYWRMPNKDKDDKS